MDCVEQCTQTVSDNGSIRNLSITNPLNCTNLTAMARGIPLLEVEDLLYKSNELIRALGEDVSLNVHVIAATRLPSKLNNRRGLVKISFRNKEEKWSLRTKWSLKIRKRWKNVFTKSSKTRVERLPEMSTRTILRAQPHFVTHSVSTRTVLSDQNWPSICNQ